MNVAHVDDLDAIRLDDGFVWRPVRRRFGIRAFGVNVYTPSEEGGQIVETHTEEQLQHEEIYLVLRGRVRFAIDDDEHDLEAGQLVFVQDPKRRRGAVALSADAAVLAVGGKPGEPYTPSAWETMFLSTPAIREGRFEDAIALHEEALVGQPDHPTLLYNLACMEARAGRRDDAIAHIRRAVELEPKWAATARDDVDFESIRDDPDFPGRRS